MHVLSAKVDSPPLCAILNLLQAENVNAREELERTNQEKQELSLKLTEMKHMLCREELKHRFSNNRIYWKFIA